MKMETGLKKKLFPEDDSIRKRFWNLIELIPVGNDEAISMTDLAKLMELSIIELKNLVLDARKANVLICSSDRGYYFPANERELSNYIFRRDTYIQTAMDALQGFRKAIATAEVGESSSNDSASSEARQKPNEEWAEVEPDHDPDN